MSTAPVVPNDDQTAADLKRNLHSIDDSLDNTYLRPGAPWGFVVYRTVYTPSSDEPWARMVSVLHSTIKKSLSRHNRPDILPRHELTLIEDKSTLAGADAHTVRQSFRAWLADHLPQHLLSPDKYGGLTGARQKLLSADAPRDASHPATFLGPRWNFCLFVDEACLRSLDVMASRSPVVKILTTDWHEDRVGEVADDWEDGETDDPVEEVGWTYMDVWEYVPTYELLTRADEWRDWYQRPYKGYVDELLC